jgi:hypothetical protein
MKVIVIFLLIIFTHSYTIGNERWVGVEPFNEKNLTSNCTLEKMQVCVGADRLVSVVMQFASNCSELRTSYHTGDKCQQFNVTNITDVQGYRDPVTGFPQGFVLFDGNKTTKFGNLAGSP